jgi:UDP-2,3-diacylglucosamine hydrolase
VPSTRVVVVADAHLGQVPPATEAAFHAFLDAVPDLGDALVVNGDLFDFWFEWGHVIPRRHFATLAKLHALQRWGVPVTFIGGNHDRWGGDFLGRDLGFAFYAGAAELDIAGRRAFVAHGDGLTEQRRSAVVLHRITRNPAAVGLFRALHPTIAFWLVHLMSRALGDTTRDPAVLDRAERAQADFARRLLERRPELGLVILAHTHRPRVDALPDGRVYLNPGAWLDGGRYAVVTREAVELRTFAP